VISRDYEAKSFLHPVGRPHRQARPAAGPDVSRSSFVEKVLRDFIEGRAQARRAAGEAAAIDRHAAKLNAEMKDALSFQAGFDEE